MSKDEYIQEYRDELSRIGKSQNTIDGYIWNVNTFIKWIEECTGEPFELPVTEFDIREYTSYLETVKAASLSTINTRLSAIQSFCDFLNLLYKHPAIKVKKKKGNVSPKVEILDRNQLYKYRQYVHKNASLLHRTIVETFLNTGIRESELCNLELDDIKATPKNAYIIIRSGKGGKYREIPIVGDYKALLLKYIKQRPKSTSNKLFIGKCGELTPNGVYKTVHRLGEAKGLRVYPHMLRHQCFTTQAKQVKNAQDLKDLSAIAGHDTVEITVKYYIRSSRQNQERLIKDMNFFE
ncbi:MAG: tyrosine-type recombinase/integrase [Lachnospiraceae bacterium]|nr:tyrosine-type recombinase/integrase [Lachnospiraceae bacterium]